MEIKQELVPRKLFSLDNGLLMGASVVSLLRNDITTQPLEGEGRVGGKMN